MGLLDVFFKKEEKKNSGDIAQERLKLILARNKKSGLDFDVEALEQELIEVVKKHIKNGSIEITTETEADMEALAIEVKF